MWEIGKTLTDSEKEFDRLIDYYTTLLTLIRSLTKEC